MLKLMVFQPTDAAQESDLSLMERIQERDEDALRLLMERKAEKLHTFCARYLGDREWAKDVVQEVFLKVWEQAGKFDPSYSVNTWVYRIAYNLSIDHLRHEKSAHGTHERFFHLVAKIQEAPPVPLSHLQKGEVERILRELSKFLSPKQKAVFVLHEVEELSTPEISQVLKCRQTTVRNHLFHARRILAEKLKEFYPEYVHA
jgi:RNA polymerase sigma-70 factor (ECF subfamily)